MNQVSKYQAWLLWGLSTLFFAFQFILRLSAGILREDIIQKFAIDAASFGTLAGYYYLGYSGMQIPIGLMLDRLSFRLVAFLAIITAGIGTFTFVISDSWGMVLIGRFLIGAGSGVGFLSVAKITKTCFEEKHHSMLIGLSFTFGLMGAVFGMTPMQILFNFYGYDYTFNLLTFICFSIGLLILIFGNLPKHSTNTANEDIFNQIINLLFNPQILLIGISGGLMVGALEGFADVWAMAYFEQVFGMSKLDSSNVTLVLYIGMCFGGPILAYIAGLAKSEKVVIVFTGILTILVFLFLFTTEALSLYTAMLVMFLLGILCCYQVLVFSFVSSGVKTGNAALAIAVTNCLNMAFGKLFHQFIGDSIQLNWDGTLNALGMPLYSKEAYIAALQCIPIGCFIGILGFLLIRTKK